MARESTERPESYRLVKDPVAWRFCPMCGERLEKEDFVVGSIPDGEGGSIPTKYNSRAICENHGILVLPL